jgi:hypothetical protein
MEQLFTEATATWKLAELYQDLGIIKGHPLTNWEKTCLRGLLCRYSPKHIAEQTYWTVNSLRTELSRRLYRYIEGLTHSKISPVKVGWNTIADSLDKLGYKQTSSRLATSNTDPPLNLSRQVINPLKSQTFQVPTSVIQVAEVIASITQLSLISDFGHPGETIGEDKIVSLSSKMMKEGNLYIEQQKYGQALQCYYSALISSTSLDISMIISIAICYNQLHLHGDSLALCYFILSFLPNSTDIFLVSVFPQDENRYKIHTFIGGIFRALAVEKSDPTYFNIALKHYDLAIGYNSLDAAPLQQQLDLILAAIGDRNFSKTDRQHYVDLALKKINNLLEFSSAKEPECDLKQAKINEQILPICQLVAR